MSNQSPAALAEAIGTCLIDPPNWRAEPSHAVLLERSVRGVVFNQGALAPLGPVAIASLVQVAGVHQPKLRAEQVVEIWKDAVLDSCEAYAREPEGWKCEDTVLFELSVARCFGVDDDRVHDLIRTFHQLPEGTRFGVFLMIEDSPAFQWMKAEIDAFEGQVDLEAPPLALRRLMRSLHAPE